jgi:hypothetical protein
MPERDRPISEEFRLVAKAWVDADAAARILEETKSNVFAKIVLDLTKMRVRALKPTDTAQDHKLAHSNAQAEHMARASDQYQEHIQAMVAARNEANLRKVQMEYVRMKFTEWQMITATARDERKMSR